MNQKLTLEYSVYWGKNYNSSKVLILLHNLHSSAFKCVKFHTLTITLFNFYVLFGI